jgi:hypothetical protein
MVFPTAATRRGCFTLNSGSLATPFFLFDILYKATWLAGLPCPAQRVTTKNELSRDAPQESNSSWSLVHVGLVFFTCASAVRPSVGWVGLACGSTSTFAAVRFLVCVPGLGWRTGTCWASVRLLLMLCCIGRRRTPYCWSKASTSNIVSNKQKGNIISNNKVLNDESAPSVLN